MAKISATFMRSIGFDNGFFNIEFMYNPELDTIGIIEVNPRMCSQFADLYEKVKGINTFEPLVQIATNQQSITPATIGNFPMAASCTLRLFKDQLVRSIPSSHDIAAVEERFPGTRIEIKAQSDKRLSDIRQDGNSYLYAVINIGGSNRYDIDQKLEACKKMLPFEFA